MSDDLRPATAVVAGGIAAMLAADIVLIAKGLAPETDVFRTRAGKVFLGVFGLHVLNVLGPCDPFRCIGWAAGRVNGWTFSGAHIP